VPGKNLRSHPVATGLASGEPPPSMKLLRSTWLIWLLLLAMPGITVAAAAETRTFLNTDHEFPTGDANGLFGPATNYPSTISVAGVPGTVTKVTATVIDLGSNSPDDIDMALVGPDGAQVMLMSDACGANPSNFEEETFTFDDAAPSFLSDNGPCASGQVSTFKPSNYENPELDDLSKEGGGPPPPYTNALSALAGGTPDGEWKLYVLDDNAAGSIGFTFVGWALNLEIEPPPAPAPTIETVTVPGPSTTVAAPKSTASPSKPAPGTSPTKTGKSPKKTGKRAAALAKCKAKKTKGQRAKCRQKAQKLPL
jgi:hypothetical protein